MKAVGFLAILFFVIGCAEKSKNTDPFFEIDQLIDQQIDILKKSGASVEKKAEVGAANDISSFVPDSAQWANELDAFLQIGNINKPIYKDAYSIEEGLDDSRSNLKIKRFSTERNIPVKSLDVYYQDNIEKLRKIEAVITDQNALFFASKKLILHFEEHQSKLSLTGYSIQGVQKMMLRDSVNFLIESKINY
ncbi:MAG: hypothetical protein KDC99_00260 [Cyclobacteriaceae bacterium]|nr:hypothetical protein [Cyclobacteriaceae bacterium]